jgi:hypothetical protein
MCLRILRIAILWSSLTAVFAMLCSLSELDCHASEKDDGSFLGVLLSFIIVHILASASLHACPRPLLLFCRLFIDPIICTTIGYPPLRLAVERKMKKTQSRCVGYGFFFPSEFSSR